jgi:hypothetical protein
VTRTDGAARDFRAQPYGPRLGLSRRGRAVLIVGVLELDRLTRQILWIAGVALIASMAAAS